MIKLFDLEELPSGVADDIEGACSSGGRVSIYPASGILEANRINPKTEAEGELFIPDMDARVTFKVKECLNDWHLALDIRPGRTRQCLLMEVVYQRNCARALKDVPKTDCIQMSVPEFFESPEFIEWLESGEGAITNHRKGRKLDEWTEVFVRVHPQLDGLEETGMPQWCRELVMSEVCRRFVPDWKNRFPYLVRLMNLKD